MFNEFSSNYRVNLQQPIVSGVSAEIVYQQFLLPFNGASSPAFVSNPYVPALGSGSVGLVTSLIYPYTFDTSIGSFYVEKDGGPVATGITHNQ